MAKKRKGRRARGTGSVFWNEKRQRWVARKVVNGVPVERWGRTQREAIEKLAEALPPNPDTVTVAQWAARWRETLTVRKSTRHDYGVSIDKHVAPALGDVRLADLRTADVERFIAVLVSSVGAGTARKIVSHLRILLAAAVRTKLIPYNPATEAPRPKHDQPEIETYSPAELAKIITVASGFASSGVIATLAGTGMRVGEVLGLDVSDWDPGKGTLAVTKTWSSRFGSGPTKSKRSRRTITVPDLLRGVLNAARGGRTDGPLFTTELGNRRPAPMVDKRWRSTLRAAGLPYRKLHCLRHSVATALIGAGLPIPDVARFIGDRIETLVRYYVHPTWADPAHTLNGLLGVAKADSVPLSGRKVGSSVTVAATPSQATAIAG